MYDGTTLSKTDTEGGSAALVAKSVAHHANMQP
jgi:hypothetical protein